MENNHQTISVAEQLEKPNFGHEILSPFLVNPDVESLFAHFPGVEAMHLHRIDLINMDPSEAELIESGSSRSSRRNFHNAVELKRATNLILRSLVHAANDVPDPQDKLDHAQALIDAWLQSPEANGIDVTIRQQIKDTPQLLPLGATSFITGFNEYAQTTQDAVFESIVDDEQAQYDLLKLMVSVQSEGSLWEFTSGQFTHEMQALRWLNILSMAKLNGERQTKVMALLSEQLALGAYTSRIAKDLLKFTRNLETEDVPVGLMPIRNFDTFIDYVTNGLSEDAEQRLVEVVAMWPKESQMVVRRYQNELINELAFVNARVAELMEGALYKPGHDYASDLYRCLTKLAHISRSVFVDKHRLGRHLAISSAVSAKRKSRPDKQHVVEEDVGAEIREREALTVKFLHVDGQLYAEDSPEYKSMISGFLDQFKSTQYLDEDVQRIFEYIKRLDLSNGSTKGIKKIKMGSTKLINGDGNRVDAALWEFKPTEAPGLSLRSNIGPRTRTLFCQVDGQTLAIAGIEHREKLDRLVKRYIVRGS